MIVVVRDAAGTPGVLAVMMLVPALTPVTRPVLEFTVATEGVPEDQETEAEGIEFPRLSRTVPARDVVAPTRMLVEGAAAMVMKCGSAAGVVTVTTTVRVAPGTAGVLAEIVATPAPMPVTSPVALLTVATAGAFEDHETGATMMLSLESRTVAVNWIVSAPAIVPPFGRMAMNFGTCTTGSGPAPDRRAVSVSWSFGSSMHAKRRYEGRVTV